jgi:hypothetical protein
MSDVREVGTVTDINGVTLVVSAAPGIVTIGTRGYGQPYRLGPEQQEEFAQLFNRAMWEAEQQGQETQDQQRGEEDR